MSDDPEIERIKARRLKEMLDQQKSLSQSSKMNSSLAEYNKSRGVVELSPATFDNTIMSPTPTLVDFWASWCGPCKTMHPVFENLAESYPHITFARVNVDECSSIATTFGIQSIPTFLMFRRGAIVDKVMGAVGPQGIHAMCQRQAP